MRGVDLVCAYVCDSRGCACRILRRLFTQLGMRIPYQYFYKRMTLDPVRTLELGPWRAAMTDDVALVLAACEGHTRIATRLVLDNCGSVSDAGMGALLPRLPRLREVELRNCAQVCGKVCVYMDKSTCVCLSVCVLRVGVRVHVLLRPQPLLAVFWVCFNMVLCAPHRLATRLCVPCLGTTAS